MRQILQNFLPRLTLFLLVATLAMLPTDRAIAAITGISASPSSIQINADGTSTVTLRWSVSALSSVPVTISSPVGDILDGATVVASPGGTLSRSVSSFTPVTIQFNETLVINRTLAKTLANGGTITYRRTFDDMGSALQHVVPIVISNSGQIAYRNIALRFDTGQSYESVMRGAALSAEALVTLSGNGVLDATWQIAKITGGRPNTFKPLRRIRRAVSGRRKLILSSPALPTLSDGVYAVRLLPGGDGAALAGVFPTIRYAVVGGDIDSISLKLNTPAAGATVVPNTLFSWTHVAGADIYRLEFSKPDGGAQALVAGVDVRATSTSARLKSFTLAKLRQSGASHWRVVAYNADGQAMAAAPFRRLSSGSDQLTIER